MRNLKGMLGILTLLLLRFSQFGGVAKLHSRNLNYFLFRTKKLLDMHQEVYCFFLNEINKKKNK